MQINNSEIIAAGITLTNRNRKRQLPWPHETTSGRVLFGAWNFQDAITRWLACTVVPKETIDVAFDIAMGRSHE